MGLPQVLLAGVAVESVSCWFFLLKKVDKNSFKKLSTDENDLNLCSMIMIGDGDVTLLRAFSACTRHFPPHLYGRSSPLEESVLL